MDSTDPKVSRSVFLRSFFFVLFLPLQRRFNLELFTQLQISHPNLNINQLHPRQLPRVFLIRSSSLPWRQQGCSPRVTFKHTLAPEEIPNIFKLAFNLYRITPHCCLCPDVCSVSFLDVSAAVCFHTDRGVTRVCVTPIWNKWEPRSSAGQMKVEMSPDTCCQRLSHSTPPKQMLARNSYLSYC